MKTIPLTQGKVAVVDDEDFERLNRFKWCTYKNTSGKWYVTRGLWDNNKTKPIYMHRQIMNASKGMQVDHRNDNGLDNRKENLRLCNNQQNSFNKKHPHKDNKLNVRGVCWHKNTRKFVAQIAISSKVINLGYFTVLADAEQAYRLAELKYFGEFAREETKKLYQLA